MTDEERTFLIAEYEASWDTIQNIDERRGTFTSYYAILFSGVLSVIAAILAKDTSPNMQTRWGLILVLVSAIVAGIAVVGVLRSERRANVDYRRRVNRIRALFLASSAEAGIQQYFQIEQTHDPKGIGRTLKWIFSMIAVQMAVALFVAYGLLPG